LLGKCQELVKKRRFPPWDAKRDSSTLPATAFAISEVF
jgi:hypothetical protein